MYITSRRFTRDGRDRFGAAIFIDDLTEDRVDSLQGTIRNSVILASVILLLIVKLLSANFLGILITVPLFTWIYYSAVLKIRINFTTTRLLIEREYLSPKFVRAFSNTLFGLTLFVIFRLIRPDILDTELFRLEGMAWLFRVFGIYDIRYFLYRQLVLDNQEIYRSLDSILTIILALWFWYQYRKISYSFTEVNLNHVSEQLVKETANLSLVQLLLGLTIFFIVELIIFQRLSFILIIISILVIQYIPRTKQLNYTLVGPSNREIVSNAIIPRSQMPNLARITSITFGWETQLDQINREYPENIIPSEVVSTFETGLRAYSKQAYRQSNIIGFIAASITNIFVILALIRFAIIYELDEADTILLIVIILTGVTIGMSLFFEILNFVRAKVKSNELLMIGEGFVCRYQENMLWILRGSSLEGTTVQRGLNRSVIRYDKTKGFIIAWERFTFLAIIGTVVISFLFWAYIGALNIQVLPLLFPSLINIGLEFLENKAQVQLEFFIVGGYVLWSLIILLYPRYYARSRPSLYLDMQYASVEPIVLRDFQEHQDASILFTKSLITSARETKRGKVSRPGSFSLDIRATAIAGTGKYLRFLAGPTYRERELDLPILNETMVFSKIVTSALKGYPEIDLIVELFDTQDQVIYTSAVKIQMFFERERIYQIELGSFGTLDLIVKIVSQKG